MILMVKHIEMLIWVTMEIPKNIQKSHMNIHGNITMENQKEIKEKRWKLVISQKSEVVNALIENNAFAQDLEKYNME